ncbi:beta-aspartyl-peptidase [Longibaculum muris]|uniref:beta-aspartyl-peptidase n=1 Tax=Longibaculum muris TaxID=1796628 RepID=UPI0022E65F81|nr:beta-aspartyl-peptidase [Longibaculum muris]
MYLIKNIDVYNPKHIGRKDVLISDKIEMIEDHIDTDLFEMIDGHNKILVPGFIDQHVHITGGGGEGSFKTKAPEITLSKLTRHGITTVLGLLGTDGISHNVENLLAKAKALKEEGISCLIVSGSYQYPPITITDDIKKDIMFIDEVVGCKLALSDHRSSHMRTKELKRLASDIRVSSMLSGKCGILILHMGDEKKALSQVFKIIESTDIPVSLFRPTHVARNKQLLEDGFKLLSMGGYIDLTAEPQMSATHAILKAKKRGLPLDHITVSSDGQGSWSTYDQSGQLLDIGVSSISCLFEEFQYMLKNNLSLEEALPFFTSNVARGLGLNKGEIIVGKDADLLLLDQNYNIQDVIALGKIHVRNQKQIIKGTYEKD